MDMKELLAIITTNFTALFCVIIGIKEDEM
jgi:hypothetical protein